MKRFNKIVFLVCGLLITLAASSVFAQEKIEINKKPFDDLAQMVKQSVDEKKVDLTKPFLVELEGVLNKDGRLDAKKSKFVKSEGDAAMIEIGKHFIEAINDSGFFQYLTSLGIEKINFALVQDESQIYANIVSEVETPNRAKTIVSGLNLMTQIIRMKKDEMKNVSEDEKIIVDGLKASSEGKTLMLKFAYDKPFIQKLIRPRLEAAK